MKIVAAFAFRDDHHLVPDLLANLQGMVDDYVCWDDRANGGIYCHERNHLTQEAEDKGADGILGIDPDERFGKNAGTQVRKLTKEIHSRGTIGKNGKFGAVGVRRLPCSFGRVFL